METAEAAGVKLLVWNCFIFTPLAEVTEERQPASTEEAPVFTVSNTAVSPFCTTNAQITEQNRKQVLSY